ncbi:uncharacterized protein K452DRAFT_313087 [Neofusicoccum parvum]|uniref:Uncharacterized protein K452DRAFT_313087 n=1 Tax=Neofusicoccum parvum TaxID=310453 RepID=A0ACB5S7J6_9PEZI|nr:uncharacterized protein K452DRAFT_313087 [Neofusicoccum parvum]
MTHLPGNHGNITISSERQQQGYSTLEVEQNANFPEVDLGDQLPESPNTTSEEVVVTPAHTDTQAERKICSLRRNTFWIVLAMAVLVVIAVIVGASIGATRSDDSGNAASSTSNDNSGVSEAPRRGIAPNSKLAAANYTDELGVEHSQVYYQDYSLQIWMADWDRSTGNWTFSKVLDENNDATVKPMNGTPIAAYNRWKGLDNNESDFRCLFLDDSSYVRLLWAPNRTGADARWLLVEENDRTMLAGANSSLTDIRSRNGLMMYYPRGNGDSSSSRPTTRKLSVEYVTAQEGTAITVAPIPAIPWREMVYPSVELYLIDDGGYLAGIYGGYNARWKDTGLKNAQELPVDPGAQLAAMSQYRQDDYNLQIMMTKTNGGVKMAYMNGDWNKQDSVEGMDSVLPLSPIAANQLGHVYALESSDNGTQLVEWIRMTGTDPSFQRVGAIDTTKT